MLIFLKAGKHNRLFVKPRWPSTTVGIDSEIFERLNIASEKLSPEIQLVVTRGYESPTSFLGQIRTILRFFGRKIFALVYPSRHSEIEEIFSPNGHNIDDGRHIDISIVWRERQISLLPLGVFTSPKIIDRHEKMFSEVLRQVQSCIASIGGKIHLNRLEALQIHVDFTV